MNRSKIWWLVAAFVLIIAALSGLYYFLEASNADTASGYSENFNQISLDNCEETAVESSCEGRFGIDESLYKAEKGVVRRGDSFSSIMSRSGVSPKESYELEQKSKGVFNLKDMRMGNHYHLFYELDSLDRLSYMVYEMDATSFVLFCLKDSLSVFLCKKEVVSELAYVEVEIKNSLWQDVVDSGSPGVLALMLSDIYAWSIDFFGLQKGDSFKALFTINKCDGETIGVGNVLTAEFFHNKVCYKAYRFDDGSGNYYWNEKGESMRKAFLKAPLSYTRISSGFSYSRRHPVTRKVRPHTGVDYAAPTGTEVMSIGDGVVIWKGFKNAEGNMVKIKHNSVYTSAYLHLSRFGKNLKVGDRVKQGQVIGYVGSTGTSTGPHLDFRIWKNGTPINPLKMDSPPAEPVREEKRAEFDAFVNSSQCSIRKLFAREVFKSAVRLVKD